MNADDFRHAYAYHFRINRKIWDESISLLTDEMFLQPSDYSIGSARNQVVHMMSVDEGWFSGLRGVERPASLDPLDFPTRQSVREKWDIIENDMQSYLLSLADDALQQPFGRGFKVSQVLFHVLNHATDHRAQLLALLFRFGVPTLPQDYAYFVMGRL